MFNRIMLWLHYFIIVSLLIAVFAKYISPLLFWLPAFFGLAYPFLFLLNIILVIFWLIQFKSAITFGLLAFCISTPMALRYVQISFPKKTEAKQIKVTSYNSMLFDLYNWTKNKETRHKILSSLSETDPDILCLQEFYTSEQKGNFNNVDTLKALLNTPYFHTEYTTTLREFDHWGVATFSKHPIINQGKIIFKTKSNNICIFSDIVIGNDTVRVYNIHLQSISFSKGDTKFLEDVISEEKDAEDELENGKSILRRLKRAFTKRTKQVDMVVTHMKTCRYKIILCGDFNDTAASYSYQQLSKKLNDAFIEKGTGFGRTYAGKWPQFRIDYILHDKRLKCTNYKRSAETHTDHYPITAYFQK
ncbi:MAG: endonuclease/exonuclease/phosphatase family protein [Bacteroidota bacterium]